MQKIIPEFKYNIEIEDGANNLTNIKERLVNAGGMIQSETASSVALLISSNSLAFSLFPLNANLLIEITRQNGKILVTVTRVDERKIAIGFFAFVSLISVASYLQKNEIISLIFPFFGYIAIYIFSILATHPAHAKIRKLLRHVDEPL